MCTLLTNSTNFPIQNIATVDMLGNIESFDMQKEMVIYKPADKLLDKTWNIKGLNQSRLAQQYIE